MRVLFVSLCCAAVAWASSPLDSLILFANGGGGAPNPSGRDRPSGVGLPPAPRPPAPRRRPQPPAQAPIPFSEPADPRRGTVSIDVPQLRRPAGHQQPRRPAVQPHQGFDRQPYADEQLPAAPQVPIPDPAPSFPGLPPGATQIGGRPVYVPRRRKPEPAPLSEINPPIHRLEDFPSPINDFDRFQAPLREPVEALAHNFLPGQVPLPLQVPQERLPLVSTLNDRSIQRLADSNRLNYDQFGDDIFGQIPQGPVFVDSQQRGGEHFIPPPTDFGSQKKDLTHEEALQKHRSEVERVKKLQQLSAQRTGLPLPIQNFQQPQYQPPQQQYQPPPQQQYQPPPQQQYQPPPQQQYQPPPQQLQQPIPQNHFQQPVPQQQSNSHFNIPGGDRHRQFAEELKLAQEALKALG